MKDTLILIIFSTWIYLMICLLLNVIIHAFTDKEIIIKFPKNKKFIGKVDPIYKLVPADYTEGYFVFKFTLKYDEFYYGLLFSWCFIPIPVQFLVYRYHKEPNSFFINETIEKITDIGELYEHRYEIQKEQYLKSKTEKDNLNKKIEDLNKIFTENYEK